MAINDEMASRTQGFLGGFFLKLLTLVKKLTLLRRFLMRVCKDLGIGDVARQLRSLYVLIDNCIRTPCTL